MPKHLFKRYLPDRDTLHRHKHLRRFGTLLHDPRLWHLNGRSVAGAMAVGLFMAFLPIPFQMLPAAAFAILFRVNLPLAVALVWITNPLTLPVFSYAAYKIGTWIMQTPAREFVIEFSWTWLRNEFARTFLPFALGSLVLSLTASLAGYGAVVALWRFHLARARRKRRQRRRAQ